MASYCPKEKYDQSHCYQYDVRLQNAEKDQIDSKLTNDEITKLTVKDFEFQFIQKDDKKNCKKIIDFITRHEWLGKMPHRPTHRFIATYKGMIAGVIVMATPNSFSNLLGAENQHLEKLISRGACISWAPKNLNSALVMFAVRWMSKNTEFRFFTAYSDTEARELGTIYQACNFVYLGTNFGARVEYFNPKNPERGWFSDRIFRKAAQYLKYASELGIEWNPSWGNRKKICWELIPSDVADQLKSYGKRLQSECEEREVPKKHKYVYILSRTVSETKRLREKLFTLHPEIKNLSYPKNRGLDETKIVATKSSVRPLNSEPESCRPQEPAKQYLSIKEVARRYGISDWTLYQFIKTDSAFPHLNVGLKKKFVINDEDFKRWMEARTKRNKNQHFHIPSIEELLKRRTA